jgi:sorbitol/mannitol transport system permease protein
MDDRARDHAVASTWMLIPLCMTLYYSFRRFRLLSPDRQGLGRLSELRAVSCEQSGLPGCLHQHADPGGRGAGDHHRSGGVAGVLLDKPMFGRGIDGSGDRALFFMMPTVSALVWKNFFFMNPVNGLLFAYAWAVGLQPMAS